MESYLAQFSAQSGSQPHEELSQPAKPGVMFVNMLSLDHMNPKPSKIVQHFKFNSRNRKHGETVVESVAVMRKLAKINCNYGEKLSEMVCDRLVSGIRDERIQPRPLRQAAKT